jgi:DNA-directed RNA polymerase subunit K/omega
MKAALVKHALEKVLNAHVLVNMVSQRVRQLNSGGGGASQPLVAGSESLDAAYISLRDIIEGKIDFALSQWVPLVRPTGRNRNRPKHWANP